MTLEEELVVLRKFYNTLVESINDEKADEKIFIKFNDIQFKIDKIISFDDRIEIIMKTFHTTEQLKSQITENKMKYEEALALPLFELMNHEKVFINYNDIKLKVDKFIGFDNGIEIIMKAVNS